MRVFRGYPLFTSHGFLIEGYYGTQYMNQPARKRCGGPQLCKVCKDEARATHVEAKMNEEQAQAEMMDRRDPHLDCPPDCPKCKAERKFASMEIPDPKEFRFPNKAGDAESEKFPDRARKIVFQYIKPKLEVTDTHITFSQDEVYIVWFTYVLGSWKALISTTLPDGMYYEVTYNVARGETYLDAYKKFDNVLVRD